jgi:hypothetical protein
MACIFVFFTCREVLQLVVLAVKRHQNKKVQLDTTDSDSGTGTALQRGTTGSMSAFKEIVEPFPVSNSESDLLPQHKRRNNRERERNDGDEESRGAPNTSSADSSLEGEIDSRKWGDKGAGSDKKDEADGKGEVGLVDKTLLMNLFDWLTIASVVVLSSAPCTYSPLGGYTLCF